MPRHTTNRIRVKKKAAIRRRTEGEWTTPSRYAKYRGSVAKSHPYRGQAINLKGERS